MVAARAQSPLALCANEIGAIKLNEDEGDRAMDNDLFEKGLAKRKSTLGAEYVEKNLASADEFTKPFQEAMTAWCWGFGWGDEVIDEKTRSMMNLSMIGALGKMHEWELHCRGALNNGVTKDCLLYTSPSPRDKRQSRMPSSA